MKKVQIAIEYVKWLQSERLRINKLKLSDIEWTENGEVLPISPNIIEKFEYTGLLNTDFINSDYYKEI